MTQTLITMQLNRILQDVQFTDQQRFKQFVSQSKARLEVCVDFYVIFNESLDFTYFPHVDYSFCRTD